MLRKQHCGDAGVLGSDDIDLAQHVDRSQRDIAQITDRCGDHI